MARAGSLATVMLTASSVSLAAQTAPLRPAAPEVTVVAGGYEIATEDGARKCLVLLRPSAAPGGQAVGFPAQCRMALPIMASVSAWTIEAVKAAPHARIRLHNSAGAVMLDFSAPADDNAAVARDVSGTAYTLKPMAGATLAQRMNALPPARTTANAPRLSAATTAAITPSDPSAMDRAAGRYALQRDKSRDTGCLMELETTAGVGKARLEAGCIDSGLTTFAPAGWRITDGTLWLVGVKGQRLSFERNRRDGWDKGPGQGAALTLMRIAP